MDQSEEREIAVSNEFDYSNMIAEVEPIAYLVQYCEALYNQMINVMSIEAERNAKLKYEYQSYEFKKNYNTIFEIKIRESNSSFSTLDCKNYDSFVEAVNSGYLNNVSALTIELNLSYKRGNESSLKEHENLFKIIFEPYKIRFLRKSNHNEEKMNQIENNINEILKSFRVQNSIFCTK